VPLACLWGVLLLCAGPAASAPAQSPLEAGIRAYRAGDFGTALELFLEARAQGPEGDTLLFNLGLTYYRLKLRRRFLGCASASHSHGGRYRGGNAQLGEWTNHRAPACSRSRGLSQVRRLADRWSGSGPAGGAGARRLPSVGLGFDSNRNQISETIHHRSEPESAYAELSGVLQYPLPGSPTSARERVRAINRTTRWTRQSSS
jgi:hypothetical protein